VADEELYESFVRLTWSPDISPLILVDYGTPLWGAINLNGSQVVDVENLVRSAGAVAYPMGNEQTSLEFDVCRVKPTIHEAFSSRLDGIIALPRAAADVLITMQNGRQWRIKNAAIESWPGSQTEFLTRESIRIVGGQLIPDTGDYNPINRWENIHLYWESLT